MTLTNHLRELIFACFSGIWIRTYEPDEALAELTQLCNAQHWALASWDLETGLSDGKTVTPGVDPLTAIRSLGQPPTIEASTHILVIKNLHRFLGSAEIVQAIAFHLQQGKGTRHFLVVLSPVVDLPIEIEKLFVVVEHDLPSREQLQELARGLATREQDLPQGSEWDQVLDAASGLSRFEAESAFALSLVRENQISATAIWELKTQALRKSGLFTLYRSEAGFDSLGGIQSLKAFTKRALRSSKRTQNSWRARGILLLSPPGCGKSQFCRVLGSEVGRPVLMLDVGALMGSLVGQTEERTRQALQIADAMAPCILMIDEIEKAFAGVSGGGANDSGVSSRMFGSFLTWLNDHETDVFVVATSNDVSRLPPEFARSERFDGIFFLDLPGREQKDAIWAMYRNLYQIDPTQRRPQDDNWTGAEIKSCCRLAALLDVSLAQASQNIVPVAVTANDSVERLRTWANGRCIDAEKGGVYQRQTATGRKVNRAAASS